MSVATLSMLLLSVALAATEPTEPQPANEQSYKTSKSVPVIQKCLIGQLAGMGEQTIMESADGAILMIREGKDDPLIVEIAPKLVKITTPTTLDVRAKVQHCV